MGATCRPQGCRERVKKTPPASPGGSTPWRERNNSAIHASRQFGEGRAVESRPGEAGGGRGRPGRGRGLSLRRGGRGAGRCCMQVGRCCMQVGGHAMHAWCHAMCHICMPLGVGGAVECAGLVVHLCARAAGPRGGYNMQVGACHVVQVGFVLRARLGFAHSSSS